MDSTLKLCIFSVLLFVFCQEPVAVGAGTVPSFDLYFTEKGTKDYVVHHGLSVSNAFTVCYRVRTTETSPGRAVFSYATSSARYRNEILLINFAGGKLRLYVGGHHRDVSFHRIEDGSWHHICASWENVLGEYKFYRNGVHQGSGHSFKRGYRISSAGTLVIGQEQDTVGGTFEAKQCYVGELTDLNVWNWVLSPDQIRKISRSCHGSVGNVKKWADFRAGIRGDVKVLPSACEP